MSCGLAHGKEQFVARPIRMRDKWRVRWFDENGVRQSAVYDDYKLAQKELSRHIVEVEEIRRGVRLAPVDKTFGDLCDYWVKNKAAQKRSGTHDESIIRCHLRGAFGPVVLHRLTVAQVDEFIVSRPHLHKKTLHNILTLLISMLRLACELGWVTRVPKIKKPRVRVFDRDFRYLRTADEVKRVLAAAREEGDAVLALYATAVYTGMREGELAGLRWEDVDFEKRLITVQRSYDGPTKGDDVRYVPILDALLPILRGWRLKNPLRVVFPGQSGKPLGRSARVFQEVLHRVLERAGLPKVERRGKERPAIVFHDLRHTFASLWMMNGGDLFRLQRILGHKSAAMTTRYAHLAPEVYATDYGRLGSVNVVPEAAVVPLAGARRG
jgi:integrase